MEDARVFDIALKRADDFHWGKSRRFNLDVVGEWECELLCYSSESGKCLNKWSKEVKVW